MIETKLSIEKYLYEIKPHLNDIINNLKMSHTLNIQLTLVINFRSSNGTNDERLVHSKSDNIEIMVNDAADEVIEESLFGFLLSRSNLPINKDKR